MDTLAIVLMLVVGVSLAAVLVRRKHHIATSLLSGINAAGALGLAWLATTLAIYDGVLICEFSLCVALTVTLMVLTLGGLALERRGKFAPAVLALSVGAVPIVLAVAVLLELQAHPIRWN